MEYWAKKKVCVSTQENSWWRNSVDSISPFDAITQYAIPNAKANINKKCLHCMKQNDNCLVAIGQIFSWISFGISPKNAAANIFESVHEQKLTWSCCACVDGGDIQPKRQDEAKCESIVNTANETEVVLCTPEVSKTATTISINFQSNKWKQSDFIQSIFYSSFCDRYKCVHVNLQHKIIFYFSKFVFDAGMCSTEYDWFQVHKIA